MSSPRLFPARPTRPLWSVEGSLRAPVYRTQEVAAHQLARIHKAMIEIVAEQGYKSLKVRDLVGRAKVSTRAFMSISAVKRTASCRPTTWLLAAPAAASSPPRGGARFAPAIVLVFEAFLRELENQPSGARFALIEAHAGSKASMEQAWRAERIFEGMLAECFARVPKGVVVPPLIVEGMVLESGEYREAVFSLAG